MHVLLNGHFAFCEVVLGCKAVHLGAEECVEGWVEFCGDVDVFGGVVVLGDEDAFEEGLVELSAEVFGSGFVGVAAALDQIEGDS